MDFWDFFWLLIWTYLFVAYLVVLFQIIGDVFRDRDLGGFAKALWMIARRGALESLRDRMTIVVSLLFAIGLPTLIVNTVVRIQVALSGPGDEAALGQACRRTNS